MYQEDRSGVGVIMKKVIIKTIAVLILVLIFLLGIFVGKKIANDNKNNPQAYQSIKKGNNNLDNFKKQENILFLGDSITEIYPIKEIYGTLPIVKSGVSGYKTTDILKRMDSMVYQYNPTKIFLLIGTNDYLNGSNNKTTEKLVSNIEKIVNNIRQNRKKAKIYVESIYPVNRNMDEDMVGDRDNKTITEANKKLKNLCKELNVIYIDMYNKLLDSDGNFDKQYTYDGLHPSSLGYAKISQVLLPYIIGNDNFIE